MKNITQILFKMTKNMSKLRGHLSLHYKKFLDSEIPLKLMYIFVAASGLGVIAAMAYLLYIFLEPLIVLATVALLVYFFKCVDTSTPATPTVTVGCDHEAIYRTLHEAICETASILNLDAPSTPRSLPIQARPMKDNFPRFWGRAKKRDGPGAGDLPLEEVSDILQAELTRVCQLHAAEFLSGLSGLYLDVCNDRGFYYELAVMPINPQTQGHIYKKEQARLRRQSGGQRPGPPPDGMF